MKKVERKMTAVKFAEEMNVDYSTIMRWLKLGLVPGAEKVETDVLSYWQIPESALKMERPLPGRKRSKEKTTSKANKKSSKKEEKSKGSGDG